MVGFCPTNFYVGIAPSTVGGISRDLLQDAKGYFMDSMGYVFLSFLWWDIVLWDVESNEILPSGTPT